MFGLTKREQRWKAEQQAAELVIGFARAVVEATAQVRIAEAEAEAERLRKELAELRAAHGVPEGVKPDRVTLTPEGEAVVPSVGVEFAMQCLARADALLQGIAEQDVVVHSAAHELHHALDVLRRAHGVRVLGEGEQ